MTTTFDTALRASKKQGNLREQRRAELNKQWRNYLQNSPVETRDITISNEGGALVQEEQLEFVSIALKQYAPLTQYANVRYSVQGREVKASRVVDTSKGLYLFDEGSSSLATVEEDPAFSSNVIAGDLFTTGRVSYSWNLVRDSGFDLVNLLTGLTDTRIGRGIESILTNGLDTGSTTTPGNPGLINIANVATTTGTLASGIGWSDIVNTFDALDPAYLPRASWLMTSKTRNFLAGLTSSTSRPFFVPAPNSGALDMLLNRPVVINESLANVTTSSGTVTGPANGIPILFGSLYDGLEVTISDPRVVSFTESPGLVENQKSALAVWLRVGSTSLAAGSIQALKLAAS
jgi:HK97 family phage major capsid protein